MEDNVLEAVTNNVAGTRNVVDAAIETNVQHFVLISTDKAVRPTSVMGATKRIAEQLVQHAATKHHRNFVSVRFGNVLGSRGIVVPTFLRQIRAGGPVTVTHPEMRRYFMTIPEAVQLVLQAGALGRGGEVFVLDMGEQIRVVDIATDLIRLSGLEVGADIEITFTGVRPGEKLYEEMFFTAENVLPTDHPKVLRARNGLLADGTIRRIEALMRATDHGRPEDEIRKLLQTLVPDFHPHGGHRLRRRGTIARGESFSPTGIAGSHAYFAAVTYPRRRVSLAHSEEDAADPHWEKLPLLGHASSTLSPRRRIITRGCCGSSSHAGADGNRGGRGNRNVLGVPPRIARGEAPDSDRAGVEYVSGSGDPVQSESARQDSLSGYLERSPRAAVGQRLVAVNVLEHVSRTRTFLRAANEAVVPGGSPAAIRSRAPGDLRVARQSLRAHRRYTRPSLRTAIETAGWNRCGIRYMNMPGIAAWFLAGRVLRKDQHCAADAKAYDRFVVPWLSRLESLVPAPIGSNIIAVATRRNDRSGENCPSTASVGAHARVTTSVRRSTTPSSACAQCRCDAEIICVDDGSSDGTRDVLDGVEGRGQIDTSCSIRRTRAKGRRSGVRWHATRRRGGIQDADLEYDPLDILRLLGAGRGRARRRCIRQAASRAMSAACSTTGTASATGG